ncbi:hypothetical protein ACLOJK_022739 [Asimina triloba]
MCCTPALFYVRTYTAGAPYYGAPNSPKNHHGGWVSSSPISTASKASDPSSVHSKNPATVRSRPNISTHLQATASNLLHPTISSRWQHELAGAPQKEDPAAASRGHQNRWPTDHSTGRAADGTHPSRTQQRRQLCPHPENPIWMAAPKIRPNPRQIRRRPHRSQHRVQPRLTMAAAAMNPNGKSSRSWRPAPSSQADPQII